jgi:hypothetical protein
MMVMLQRFWVQLTSDRKRFGLLCAVLAAGLLLWARLIIVSKVPRTAVAETDALLLAGTNAGDDADGAEGSDNSARPIVKFAVLAEAHHDPFLINRDFFPKPSAQFPSIQEPGKSNAEPVENPEQEKARRQLQLLAHVEQLKLDAAMTGTVMAVISGRLYQLNDMIPAKNNPNLLFQLTEVRARSVVLRHNEFTFELSMAAPGQITP